MSVVFFLIKFFDNEDHGRDFVSGRIYANTLAKFKRLEGVDDSGRGDRNEGTIAWLQPGQGRLEINGMDITDDLAGPVQLQKKLAGPSSHLLPPTPSTVAAWTWRLCRTRTSRSFESSSSFQMSAAVLGNTL